MKNIPNAQSSLQTWLNYLEQLHTKTIDLGLDRLLEVAERLNYKNNNSVKIVVAGTNGKGSTCAMLESIYLSAGYKVGLYTSPHLIHFNERIRLNGELVSNELIVQKFTQIEQARGDISLTYFEYTTLAAILIFNEHQLDLCIYEVGLGGRLDAVNIIDADCSIVTNIDIDHKDYLGDTREMIAFEKAHVYRPGKPAICSDPEPPQSLLDYADKIGADLWLFGKDFNYAGDKQQWAFAGREQRKNALAYPALRGANQLLNASAALAAIEALRLQLPVPIQGIREGFLLANLPGRFQILPGQPVTILDVAHNPHSASVLAHNLENMAFFPYTTAIVGMLNDKEYKLVIEKFSKIIDYWYCVDLSGERGLKGEVLAEFIENNIDKDKEGFPVTEVFATPLDAYKKALERVSDNDRIVIFGSFNTVAPIIEYDLNHH